MSQAAHSIGDPEREAQAWLAVATVYDRLGKFKEAIESAAKAEDIAKGCDCPKEEANALLMKGQQNYRLGDVDQAEPLLKKAMSMHKQKLKSPLCHVKIPKNSTWKTLWTKTTPYAQNSSQIDSPKKTWLGRTKKTKLLPSLKKT